MEAELRRGYGATKPVSQRAGLHVGFTGPRSGMTPYQRDRLRARLAELQAEHGEVVFHYGQAVGADAVAGAIAHALGWRVVSHPSDRAAATATVVPGAEVREPKPPLVRNRDIVHESDVLLATPRTVEEELRSGTWATIRYALRVGVPVELIYPLPYHGSCRAGSTPDTEEQL